MMHIKPNALFAERINKLADVIAPMGRDGFDLSRWRHPCGTPSCLAGHSAWMAHNQGIPYADFATAFPCLTPERVDAFNSLDTQSEGARWLGLDDMQSSLLFVPSRANLYGGLGVPHLDLGPTADDARQRVTAPWAARVLRHLARTGDIEWTRLREAA